MKVSAILLALALGGASFPAFAPRMPVEKPATVWLGYTDGTCSGTYIGRDLVLTASHCSEGGPLQKVSGVPCQQVGEPINDGSDHAIIRVTCKRNRWSTLGGSLYQGEEVHWWGNPGGLSDMFRRGYVMGTEQGWFLIDARVNFGDSGSGIFDRHGHIVSTVSTLFIMGENFRGMGAKPLRFTREQLASVGL